MFKTHGSPLDERANPYPGLIDDWKVRLVRRRARRLGFRRHELDDALQELVLPILQFRYDVDRSNGASEKTALCALIDHQLKAMIRRQARYCTHIRTLRESRTPQKRSRRHVLPSTADFTSPSARIELSDLLATFPSEYQRICVALIDGHSIHQTAQQLRCSWHRIDRLIAQIRRHFHQQGLRGVRP